MTPIVEPVGETLNARVTRLSAKLSLINLRRTLRPAGVSVQEWRALVDLAQLGEAHLREVARVSGVDPSHLSQVFKKMERAGFIQRRADPDDARRVRFSLTGEGQALYDRISPQAEALGREFAALYSDEERAQLYELLERAADRADELLD